MLVIIVAIIAVIVGDCNDKNCDERANQPWDHTGHSIAEFMRDCPAYVR